MTTLIGSLPVQRYRTACFSIVASAEAGAMPRVLEVFAKRGLVPSKWQSTLAGRRGEELHIDVQVDGVDSELQERLVRCLRQVVAVQSVLISEKHLLRSA